MRTNIFKRFVSLVMALAMVLLLVPVSPIHAAETNTYVLDATADLSPMSAGEKADSDMDAAGTDGYFTIIYSAKTKIDGSNKTFDDGYTASQRLNFGGSSATDPMKNMVMFKTDAPATVKIWWVSGGDGREFAILNSGFETVTATSEGSVKNSLYISTLNVDAAGTYYLAVPDGSNYLFRLEVAEEVPEVTVPTSYILDTTADLTAMSAGAKADGDMEQAGTDGYFTIIYSAKTKIDGSNKTFDDGYTASQRLNFGGSSTSDPMKNLVRFTTGNAATVKIWWVSGGDGREFAIWNSAFETVTATSEGSVKNSLYISTLNVDAAGTYYLAVPDGSNYLFKLEITEEVAAPEVTYALDATADLAAMAAGEKADGDMDAAGTDGYFTIIYSAKTKIDGSNKTFDDGYTASQRLNFGGSSGSDPMKNLVMFKTDAPATVKIWWVSGGDGREFAIWNSAFETVTATSEGSVKNSLYISNLALDAAGTYYLAVPDGSNYLFRLEVTVGGGAAKPERASWNSVAAPVITSAVQEGGDLLVTVSALIGYDGADKLAVTMYDDQGNEVATKNSLAEKSEHTLTFSPDASGAYTLTAVLSREEETDKVSETLSADFILPLETPYIYSATSTGNGGINVVWGAVPEAESYEIYCDGALAATTTELEYEVTGLTVGNTYSFTVVAVRGEDKSEASAPLSAKATADAQVVWGFATYGSSTSTSANGYTLNDDGTVTVYSTGGKGKIVPNSTDGIAFYYTAIPTDHNFTLRATIAVDSWTFSNAQEGFGLLASDRLGTHGNSAAFWTNSYMAAVTKNEYYSDNGTKYSMKLGVTTIARTGITAENLPLFEINDTNTVNTCFSSVATTLETYAADQGLGAGTYNIAGNFTGDPGNTILELTEFTMEIQKNNTGYFVTYYDAQGNVIKQVKNYDPDALNAVDADNVYVGFFAARNATITVKDYTLTTIPASEDAPAEERPVTYVTPSVAITSASSANDDDYTVYISANVAGTATVTVDGTVVAENVAVTGGQRCDVSGIKLVSGNNKVEVTLTPDPEQDLGEYTELSSTDPVSASVTVSYRTDWADQIYLYVAPNGTSAGTGSKADPLDIYTAVKYVRPGQTIVLMEGTYALTSTVRIEHGIDGGENGPCRMIADPNAATRPVLDFQGACAGIVHGGDYWYFRGFDVTGSQNGQKGFQVSGHMNTLDQINTYRNGNTGIQISRYAGSDPISEWPSYNLILNCTSHNNADAGYEDADGFAAKLTCGEGNIFDGCVAYHNADDGWDLYAKVETGPIGAVTIQNCVAYENGYIEAADGSLINAGNGNGFKMGGESLSGKHTLINSFAFFNKAKGIDSNSCPDIIVNNSTSYNNQSYNVAFYTNNAANTNFIATGILSFKDETIVSGLATGEQFKPKGSQDTGLYLGDTNYYWNGSASQNASGAAVTADMFVSLTFTGITRNADGTINMNGFLQLKDDVSLNAGATATGTPSDDVEIPVIMGDVNGDNEVDIFDANLIVGYYNGTAELTADQLIVADVNCNGEVDIFDANLVVAYYNGTVPVLPAE